MFRKVSVGYSLKSILCSNTEEVKLENLVNLVGRMSLGERLDTDLGEPDTDK